MAPQFRYKSFVKLLWGAIILGILMVAAIFVMVSKTQMPDTKALENPEYEYASMIYSSDMQELGRYYKYNREWLDFDEINPHLVNALIATEDERFYKHSGIDLRSTIRAFFFLGKKGGASTITQQLAKLFFTQRASSFVKRVWQKLKEWVIAAEFEKRYTKQEILSMYLNKFDFLHNSHGVGAAAITYFGKNQKKLTLTESAILVGMLKNPSLFNPKKYPTNATKRRNVVLKQMVKNNLLKEEEYHKLRTEAIDNSKFKRSSHNDGHAPYFRATLTSFLKALLDDPRYKKPDGSKYNIYQDGLKIYTTIDMGMQQHAEAAMRTHMKSLQKKYNSVWKDKNPWTHDANPYQESIRTESLNRLVRNSDRFIKLRGKYLSQISQELSEAHPKARLWDADIMRMIKASKEEEYLHQLRLDAIITKSQETVYKDMLADAKWPAFKTAWLALNQKAKTIFNKPVEMKVFDFNFEGEKDTIMSPLDSVKYHRMFMQFGSISMVPNTGEVKTWVGGIGHKYFKYDHVKSDRQVGSTFKPFVYATAISRVGFSPCHPVPDIQYIIPKGDPDFGLLEEWRPGNANEKFSGKVMTLMEGLKTSTNSISVWLMKQIGNANAVRETAVNFGIEKDKIPNAPSICLGTPAINALELTSAYNSFANDGIYNKPIFIQKIEDNNGKNIYTAIPEERRVLASEYNYTMVEMLKYAASSRASWLKSEFGGKTGTTNDYVDGWFMGISPTLVTGTWVGGEDPWIRFLTLANGAGSKMARPVYLDFMQKLESDSNYDLGPHNAFKIPEGDLVETDCSKYDQLRRQQQQKAAQDTTPKFERVLDDEFDDEFEGN